MEGCTCWYSVCQPLTAFSEISAHVLEIADLGVDLTTTCDSHDQDWTSVTCWVIMCAQSLWCVTGTEDAVGVGSQEEEDVAAVVETMAGGGWNENVWLVVALGCMSQNHLH